MTLISLFKQQDKLRFEFVRHLFSVGWTLRAIGEAFNPPVPRSTVQYWIKNQEDLDFTPVNLEIFTQNPTLKTPEGGYQRVTAPSTPIPPYEASRLEKIASEARYYRSGMSSTSAPALANSEMDEIVRELYKNGTKIADIARAAGVTHRAIKKRLEKLENFS
jgi:hypothetical protein